MKYGGPQRERLVLNASDYHICLRRKNKLFFCLQKFEKKKKEKEMAHGTMTSHYNANVILLVVISSHHGETESQQ